MSNCCLCHIPEPVSEFSLNWEVPDGQVSSGSEPLLMKPKTEVLVSARRKSSTSQLLWITVLKQVSLNLIDQMDFGLQNGSARLVSHAGNPGEKHNLAVLCVCLHERGKHCMCLHERIATGWHFHSFIISPFKQGIISL